MAGKAEGNRDSSMSAHLKQICYPHGRRWTHTKCPPIPNLQDVGSAAYRRLMDNKKGSK